MLDLAGLAEAVARHGRVARVVIAAHEGSSPREAGTAMLVWAGGQSGTIGGGALEWEAATRARALLAAGGRSVARMPLGPALGQCCGGAVTLLTEVFDPSTLPRPENGIYARPTDGRDMPLLIRRMLDRARAQGVVTRPQLAQGWFAEPVARLSRPLWIWGAGHVGRALVAVLSGLPDFELTWADVDDSRFPDTRPDGVTCLTAADPADLVPLAPRDAVHLIVTFSHALDLELCHRLLGQGFDRCGVIGSATKWARFRSRLATLGHAPQRIARIDCPIGDPALGKHPQAIAIGVAAALLRAERGATLRQENAG